jgi:hypothetical protein
MKLMKMNITFFKFATVSTCLLLVAIECRATNIYEYDWLGGEPGYSGKIFLDAPSSASAPNGGTLTDVLAGSYLTTPLGNYPIFDSAFSALTAPWVPDVVWDQTHIIDMALFFKPTTPIYYPIYGQPTEALAQVGYFNVNNGLENVITQNGGGWSTPNVGADYSGQWLAVPVPEPVTITMAAPGIVAFMLFRHRAKVGQTPLNKSLQPTPRNVGSSASRFTGFGSACLNLGR